MIDHALERRVRFHAALAEPHRLRIVDALAVSDASPAELGRRLGLASNLLAHHLRTLEDAGVLTRRRSQGDRRRTYLTLDQTGLADLTPFVTSGQSGGPGPSRQASRVVFVCTANTARSQLAAALWNQASPVPATSAGTHPADRIAPGALAVARRHKLPVKQIRPRALRDLDDRLTDHDYLVTVCDNAHEELTRAGGSVLAGEARVRLGDVHWSVPDPVTSASTEAFNAAYDDLALRVATLARRITPA